MGMCNGLDDENGDPLSEKNLFGGPYGENKFCYFLIMESADLEEGY